MRIAVRIPTTPMVAIAAAMLVSACASSSHGQPPAASGEPSPSVSLLTYRCENGALIRATYPTEKVALVRYKGDTHEMRVVRAASGVRYVGDGLQWWTKGNGPGASGRLSHVEDAADADGEIIETCSQVDSGG